MIITSNGNPCNIKMLAMVRMVSIVLTCTGPRIRFLPFNTEKEIRKVNGMIETVGKR